MKMLEINTLSLEELKRNLEEIQESYAGLRFQKATHQLDNPVRLRYLRKDISRLKTVIHEFENGIRKPKVTPNKNKSEDNKTK
ncbi:50S ribosomal protein L29 [candidate division KSB1 bacterium]